MRRRAARLLMGELRFAALGGTCELYAVDPAEPLADTAEWILSMHRLLTRFEPSSELSRLNARAGEWVDVSDTLLELLEEALVAYGVSGGLVHVGVLPALMAAGYDRTWEEVKATERLRLASCGAHPRAWDPCDRGLRGPREEVFVSAGGRSGPKRSICELKRFDLASSPEMRAAAPACSGYDTGCVASHPAPNATAPLPELLELRAGAARLAPGAALDLGGIAKGWIADRAVERMGPNSLANCAGDLMARGAGPGGQRWPYGGRGHHGDGWPVRFADRTLLLDGMAAATSGTTKRRWGARSHHLIDPRTGRPAASDLREVSVLARSALDAEVLAKAALLLGSAAAPSYLDGRALGWALIDEDRQALTPADRGDHPYKIVPVQERLTA